ncbi:uncharacterized protein LOC105307128 [Pteropus vampyrus]|uniref:Uncharacterized protein LOC105307128 n=1 Tax=Pteropus vampyrus TaxID=132908 RepID=A0A6P6BZ39_PTEVA|nr:uncharacterized protein LOC105307128 [Pteropus vampyrus]
MAHQLLCCEVETIRRAYPDANLLNDRVLRAMLKAEETCAPSVSYFKCVQKEILPSMRKIVATWMLEVRGFRRLSERLFLQLVALTHISLPLISLPLPHPNFEVCRGRCFQRTGSEGSGEAGVASGTRAGDRGPAGDSGTGRGGEGRWAHLQSQPCALQSSAGPSLPRWRVVSSGQGRLVAKRSPCHSVLGFAAGLGGAQLEPVLPLTARLPAPSGQDCLRACQEQIEALLESSLRQAQQQSLDPKAAEEEEEEEEEADLACTPTDVRDVNI